ncbi:MAG: hypothetical protein E7300_10910 [Lachnospiraceae bacterium]|nr:hypothetical protein [Lachnospiraceae bacterium]
MGIYDLILETVLCKSDTIVVFYHEAKEKMQLYKTAKYDIDCVFSIRTLRKKKLACKAESAARLDESVCGGLGA